MTANHDTPEEVEAMDHNLRSWCVTSTNEAAAMLRRLHQRAVDAERERDELQGLLVTHEICADRIKATARADALNEAHWLARKKDDDIADAILARIKQSTTTGET